MAYTLPNIGFVLYRRIMDNIANAYIGIAYATDLLIIQLDIEKAFDITIPWALIADVMARLRFGADSGFLAL